MPTPVTPAAAETPATVIPASPTSAGSPRPDDAASSTSDDVGSYDSDEEPPSPSSPRFGFIAKTGRRQNKSPTTAEELQHFLDKEYLLLIQTGPASLYSEVLAYAKQNLDSIKAWTTFSTEVYRAAKINPGRVSYDHLPADYPLQVSNGPSTRDPAQRSLLGHP